MKKMSDSLDRIFYTLVAIGFIAPFALLSILRSLYVPSIVGLSVLTGIFSYAAFWGFTVGRGLGLRPYRRQALWVATAGAFFAGQWLLQAAIAPYYPYGTTPTTRIIVDSYNDAGYTLIFAWTDVSIPLLRRSDRLMRDLLHWKKLRLILWPLVLLGFVGHDLVLNSLTAFTGEPYTFIRNVISTVPYVVILLGAITLGLGMKRSRDPTLDRHVKWFGLSALLIIFTFLLGHFANTLGFIPASSGLLIETIDYVLLTFAGIFLYRSAKHLVPLSKISSEFVTDLPAPKVTQSTVS